MASWLNWPPSHLEFLPGFRFHPTDEELVLHYLWRKAESDVFSNPIITELNLYKFDPWELPGKAVYGEGEWYFFSPRDRKYPNGARPNRAAGSGYWKATGTDRPVHTSRGTVQKIGVKKALVFYKGRAPKGAKTSWIMHEYRLVEGICSPSLRKPACSLSLDDWVLCRIFKKSTSCAQIVVGEDLDNPYVEKASASLPEFNNPSHSLPVLGPKHGVVDLGAFWKERVSTESHLVSHHVNCLDLEPASSRRGILPMDGRTSRRVQSRSNRHVEDLQAAMSIQNGGILLPDSTRIIKEMQADAVADQSNFNDLFASLSSILHTSSCVTKHEATPRTPPKRRPCYKRTEQHVFAESKLEILSEGEAAITGYKLRRAEQACRRSMDLLKDKQEPNIIQSEGHLKRNF